MRRKINMWSWCMMVVVCSSIFAATQSMETVLYSFGSNINDGVSPSGRLVFDPAGNLYGTTAIGGSAGYGTAFELVPSGNGWTELVIYNFCSVGFPSCLDGSTPVYGLTSDQEGNLYGATLGGGSGTLCPDSGAACGMVFELSPPSMPGEAWTETVLWNFGSYNGDGCGPGELIWDMFGNLYGVTGGCGLHGGGTVFELSPPAAQGNNWTETILYNFCPGGYPCSDGSDPMDGVVFDSSGNLYGPTYKGGLYNGVLYELSPPVSGEEWTETVLYTFTNRTGGHPAGGLSITQTGNLYGTVSAGGAHNSGAAFRLVREPNGWRGQEFAFDNAQGMPNSTPLPFGSLVYGTTSAGVFQISGKNEALVYRFCSQPNCIDGEDPSGPVISSGGNLYGTTSSGGEHSGGVVYMISR